MANDRLILGALAGAVAAAIVGTAVLSRPSGKGKASRREQAGTLGAMGMIAALPGPFLLLAGDPNAKVLGSALIGVGGISLLAGLGAEPQPVPART